MKKDDGGAAFPGNWMDYNSNGEMVVRESYVGMSLRDWFAGQALKDYPVSVYSSSERARLSYEDADALLAERSKG